MIYLNNVLGQDGIDANEGNLKEEDTGRCRGEDASYIDEAKKPH